jgi:multidrug resistance efflux pump
MSDTSPELKREKAASGGGALPSSGSHIADIIRQNARFMPFLITLIVVAVALPLTWAMWNAYMETPWTRDGTVRAYVVTVAPEIAGRIVELPVADNQFVHKGDLLMKIDPTNYQIAVNLSEAAVQQAEANIQNVDSQIAVQEAQIAANQAQVDDAQAALSFASQQAARYADLAKQEVGSVQMAEQTASGLRQAQATLRNAEAARTVAQRQIASLKAQRGSAVATLAQASAELNQARANFKRVEVLSPVNGWVTNLLSQLGDYANTGQSELTLIDADSFWIDAYFTETALGYIHEGDPADIKLMGHGAIVRGRVGGVARGINIPNAQPGSQGLATVNPVFTWVRLAQRVPVRIEIEHVPEGVTLVAGLTATVQINPQPQSRETSGH